MMLKIAFALLALWALVASAQECAVTLCPASTKCVEDPHECLTYPCAQVKCVPIGSEDPCATSACAQDQVCLPEPKWCIRAPCPQYRCVSYEEFTCATALCPYNTKCTYSPKQCFTTPCPQYDCEPQDAVDETCATATCPQNSVCVSEPKQCFTTPCPQFACLPKTECPEFCTEEYSPVCGSNKRTYSNLCELKRAMCVTKVSLYVSSSGPCDVDIGDCPAFCPANYEPVCGTDSNTYSNLCTLQRSACQTKASISVAHQGACEDCNFACTLEYAPVCGSDGNTYANLCSLKGAACRAKSSITAQYNGECKTAETTCPEFCPMNYSPVCGTDAHTYSNLCLLSVKACKEKSSLKVAHEGACSAQVNAGAKTQEPNTAGVVVGTIIAFVVGIALIVAGYMYIKKRNAPKAPQFSQFVNESL